LQAIPAENRAQFIQDSFAFSEAGIIGSEIPFEVIRYLPQETDELVWLGFLNRVSFFYNMFVTTSTYGEFQSYMSSLVKAFYNKLAWEEKSSDTWIERL
jgi:hypothetical protein